ncbi:MAG TPA: Wzz/FepE/Etk N-terminal domain-containing protein, partial [Allocoleopsis sp.]
MKTEQPIQTLAFVKAAPSSENDEGGLNLGQFWAALRRRSLLIVGITTAVTLAAGVKAFSDTPVYNSKFEILVQGSTAESEVISSLPPTATQGGQTAKQKLVDDDLIRILSSSKVLMPVVQELQKRSPNTCNQLVAPASEDEAAPAPVLTEEELTKACYKMLSQRLKVSALGQESNIVQVTYQGANPDEVRAVLDLTSKAYLDYSLQSRQTDIRRGIEFVEGKLPDLRDRVALLQDQLQQLRQRYNLIDPESRGSELTNQVSSFREQQLTSKVELDQARERASDLQGQLSQGSPESAASSALSSNSRYQTLINQLLNLDAQIAQASTIYLDTMPEMQILKEQRQNLIGLLGREAQVAEREVSGQVQELEVRDQAISETLGSLKSEVNDLAVISRIYSDIQRELQIATDNLNQFLTKREALQIDAAQREIPW